MAEEKAPCLTCVTAEELFKENTKHPNFFLVHADRDTFFGKGRHKSDQKNAKQKLRDGIEKRVSALRNSRGGVLLIHLCGHKEGDGYLEYFHTFIDKNLQRLIEGGGSYVHTYVYKWLCEWDRFGDIKDIIAVNIQPTKGIVTVDFNTKIPSDCQNETPSTINILSLLSQIIVDSNSRAVIRGIDDPQSLQYSRHVELKAFKPSVENQGKINSGLSGLVEYIWHDLKLKDNLTSLSKVLEGGSYYVGIGVKKIRQGDYRTKVPDITGFTVSDRQSLRNSIYEKLKTDVIVLNLNGTFSDAPGDLIAIQFHEVRDKKFVLEVAVRYFSGIVFYEKQGPRTYHIKSGKICRMDRKEWYSRLHQRLPVWHLARNNEEI